MTVTSIAPTAPSRRAWLIWGIGLAAYMIAVTNRTSLAAVGVDTAERFEVDASILSMFAVLQLAVYAFFQIPAGIWLDRWGARPIMTIGMVLMAVGQLIVAFSPNVGVAIAARMLIGAGDAFIFPGVLRVIATWFPATRSPIMVQLTGLFGQLGQIVAVVPLAALLYATSWEFAFASLAALALFFAVLVFVMIQNHPPGYSDHAPEPSKTGAGHAPSTVIDTGSGIRAAWRNPGTRLAFWTHFTPGTSMAFIMLWGIPFMTVGEGLSRVESASVMTVLVIVGMFAGPTTGAISARAPHWRSHLLVLPAIGAQMITWFVVIFWPGQVPAWMFFVLAVALATGGSASMVSFDHVRMFNPRHRISTASGITNVGGFLAALITIFLIGVALDLQGAGTPETYNGQAFRYAFLVQVPIWLIGGYFIIKEQKRARIMAGLDQPKPPRARRRAESH